MSDTKKENKKASQNSEEIVEKSDEMLDEKAEEVIDETVVENIEETAEDMTEETIEEPTAKKVEKKAEQKADESSSNEEFRKLPFIEKCKKKQNGRKNFGSGCCLCLLYDEWLCRRIYKTVRNEQGVLHW